MSTPNHKAPPRPEVLDELIDEKLKIREAKRWGIDLSDAEVDMPRLDGRPDAAHRATN